MTALAAPRLRSSYSISAAGVPRILIAGQSNASGQAQTLMPKNVAVPHYLRCKDETLLPAGFWEPAGAYIRNQAVSAAISTVVANFGTKAGCQPQLATDLLAAGKFPTLVTVARSGTSLDGNWGSGQPLRVYLASIMAEVFACGIPTTDWHFVWIQGEADAQNAPQAANYQTNLTNLVAYVRTLVTGVSGVNGGTCRAYIVKLNSALPASPYSQLAVVQAAESAFVGADSNAELLDWDAFSFAQPHYLSAGYASGGSNIATRVQANM